MSENTDSVSQVRPRRGLPRRSGETEASVDGENSQAMQNSEAQPPESVVAQSSSEAPESAAAVASPGRRRGLPRPGEVVTTKTSAATASPGEVPVAAEPAAVGGRRAGLPRPGTPAPSAEPALAQSVMTPAMGTSRRTGLGTNSVASTAQAPAETEAVPAATGRRAGLGANTAPIEPTVSSPTSVAPTEKDLKKPISKWTKIAAGLVGLLILAGVLVLLARWMRTLEPIHSFMTTYPGESHLPENAPVGLPAWLGWQHFLNAFFIVLIIRTGWQVRTQQRPPASWTRNNDGLLKTKNPPKKISLTLWAHLALDFLWFLNGIVFVIVLFATGQWMRVVPTSWDVFPNALSAMIQYVSLDWPSDNGWVNYNGLQLLAYFTTIFIAAPLAAITGVRMSGAWPVKAEKLNKIYPMELARAIHFPVMLYFSLFIIMHVFLVFATGALRNLNHMYASQDTTTWAGFWIFFASLVVMAGAVFAARPLILAPIAQLMGKVGR